MFAVSTRVKEACDLWNSGKFNTTGELSKYMKITSIGKYLKIGNKYNWCKYDAEYESCKVIKNNAKNSSKDVEIFKNNISLGIFISSAELQKLSEKLFGVFLYSCEINRVCNGTKSHYKGFNFKYTNCQPNDEIKYKKGKKVKVFKDGNLIGIYESCNELARISEKEFGKKF
jgi:hypothetical protein